MTIWSSRKKKKGIFCTIYFVRRKFFDICFILLYSVLNTISEYTYFSVSKNVTLYTALLVFKHVKSVSLIQGGGTLGKLWIFFWHPLAQALTPSFPTTFETPPHRRVIILLTHNYWLAVSVTSTITFFWTKIFWEGKTLCQCSQRFFSTFA